MSSAITSKAPLALSSRSISAHGNTPIHSSSVSFLSSSSSVSSVKSLNASLASRVDSVSFQRYTTSCKVKVGDAAPAFTLRDQNGRSVSLSKFKGRNVVLYFYPADDTPGCTKEACAFRDSYTVFKKLGAEVIGVSGDSPESHKTFAEKYDLPYTLLTDESNVVRKEWGIPGDLFGVLPGRQTYVIDKKGIVKLIFNNQFQPEKHVEKTLEVLSFS